MKISKLREIIENLDDDMEIFVAPMIELKLMNPKDDQPQTELSPSPYERYRLTTAVHSGEYGEGGALDISLLLGYDDTRRYVLGEKRRKAKIVEEFTVEEFIN